jgi:hypothetical protein
MLRSYWQKAGRASRTTEPTMIESIVVQGNDAGDRELHITFQSGVRVIPLSQVHANMLADGLRVSAPVVNREMVERITVK